MPEGNRAPRVVAPAWPAATIVGLFLIAAIPLATSGSLAGRPGFDQFNYHEPMIREMARTWPRADVGNGLSATTPLYHWLLAGVARFISDSTAVLQLVAAGFTAALLALLVRAVVAARPDRPLAALLLAAPFAASLYVFPSGVWLLPDNAGWLGVLAVWLLALRHDWTTRHAIVAALVLALLALTRQIHIWTAAPIWAAAWLGRRSDADDAGGAFLPWAQLLAPSPDRVRRILLAGALTLPAFAVVAGFVALWGGLTVPRFQGFYRGIGPAVPAFTLTLLAGYSVFYAGWLIPGLVETLRRRGVAMVVAAAIGLVVAVIPQTTYSIADGRFAGLWNLARGLPVIADRSPLFLVGAPIGAAVLVLWLASLSLRDRVVMLTAIVAFTAAQTTSSQVWQRYQEPMLLMFVILAATRSRSARRDDAIPRWCRAWMVAGPALLAVLFASLTATTLARGTDARAVPRDPLTSPHYRGPPTPPPRVYTEEPIEPAGTSSP